jgi:hypothetical protein
MSTWAMQCLMPDHHCMVTISTMLDVIVLAGCPFQYRFYPNTAHASLFQVYSPANKSSVGHQCRPEANLTSDVLVGTPSYMFCRQLGGISVAISECSNQTSLSQDPSRQCGSFAVTEPCSGFGFKLLNSWETCS